MCTFILKPNFVLNYFKKYIYKLHMVKVTQNMDSSINQVLKNLYKEKGFFFFKKKKGSQEIQDTSPLLNTVLR